jgi:hypothetical protein
MEEDTTASFHNYITKKVLIIFSFKKLSTTEFDAPYLPI